MATATTLSEQAYRELALNEEDRFWELWDGVPVEKPWMSIEHNAVALYLGVALANQLDRRLYRITVNGDRARPSPRNSYIPDVIAISAAYQDPLDRRALGIYTDPLPLVVEVWSPTTGDYDIEAKLPVYRTRGDLEIWFIYPYERTLTARRRQPDSTYTEERYKGGIVPVASLPGVSIDLDALLDG
ncbi:MAG: Uma2 family endonuclease [Chloroflexia bacterium]|nr:Uma2 family endonuclease [Chloroflexia bacterium]